jgi:flagellar biosynthesis protein FliP
MKTFLIILFVMATIIVAWWISELLTSKIGKEIEYNRLYDNTALKIRGFNVTKTNYNKVKYQIDMLEGLPYKNKEKTDVLKREFSKKFNTLAI